MFSCCSKPKQNIDDDEFHPRSTLQTNTSATNNSQQIQTIVIEHNGRTKVTTPAKWNKKQSKEFQKQLEKWQKECLAAHNRQRAKHGVKPLKLKKQLNAYATEWANHLANNNLIQHRDDNKYGENIAHCTGIFFTPELCVQKWYDEIEYYNFQQPELTSHACHFTQIVWKNTKYLGAGMAMKDNSMWVVCNYDPPGNIMGQQLECVPSPKNGSKTSSASKQSTPKSKSKNDAQTSKKSRDTKNFSDFELDCLESHNNYRAIHGCPELKLNRKMCDFANEWSKRLAKRRTLQHRPDNQYGENLYYCMNFDPSAEDCVKSWYDEIQHYNFSNPGFSSQTGHFTAVVWKDTEELGVGITKMNNLTYIVCNYSPAGNVRNYYKDQVPPPIRGKKPPTATRSRAKPIDEIVSFENSSPNIQNQFRVMDDASTMTFSKNSNVFTTNSTHVRKTQISYTISTTRK